MAGEPIDLGAGAPLDPALPLPDAATAAPADAVVDAAPGAAAAPEPPLSPEPAAEKPTGHEQPTLLEEHDAAVAAKDAPKDDKKPDAAAAKDGDKPAAEPKADEKKPEAKVEGDKPVEKPPVVEKTAEEVAAAEKTATDAAAAAAIEAAALTPIEYKFEMPPEIKADDPRLGEFTAVLNEGRTPPEVAQKFLDLHTNSMREYAQYVHDEQMRAWNETRKGWRTAIMADELLGGAGHQTAMTECARARDVLVPKEDRAAFSEMLRTTGVGDHPEFMRFLHRASRMVTEPTIEDAPANPKPAPQRQPGNRRGIIYDHPSSKQQ